MRKILFWCVAIASLAAASRPAQAQCPAIPDNSALAGDKKPYGWAPGTKIQVYVDSSKLSANAVKGVTNAVNNWSSALSAYNVTVSVTTVNGLPASPTGSYLLVGTGDANGFGALTSADINLSTRGVNHATTFFDATKVANASEDQVTDLMAHEFSHTFWEGDCTSTSCQGTSVSYQNGNTLSGPSQCDKTAIQNTEKANFNSNGGSGGGSGKGGGNVGCAGPPPNDTCSCDATGNYVCDCPGLPPTCGDGTEGVCFNSSWTCGTVTTSSCTGAPPTCPDGSDASCDSDQWTCPSNDCTDPCNPSCSNYDPTDPSCGGGGCDPTVDPSCGGGGGGGCDTDCCLSVTPCDVACDMVPLQQRRFWTAAPSAAMRTRPPQLARARQQCAAASTTRAKRAVPRSSQDVFRIADRLMPADVLEPPGGDGGNLPWSRFAELAANAPSRGAAKAPVTIVEFSDFECPYCERMAATLLKQVLPGQEDNVRLVHKYFPLPMHAWAQQAAEIGECARMQDEGAFWQLHDFFFARQRSLASETLEAEAMRVLQGNPLIDAQRLSACVAHHEARERVMGDVAQGQRNGVHGTPTLFINGIRLTGAQDADLIRKAIAQAEAGQAPADHASAFGPSIPWPPADHAATFCDPAATDWRNPCLF